jgi:zinc protease
MKKTTIALLTVALIASAMFGCGERIAVISVDSEGYGRATLDNGLTVLINHDKTTSLTAATIVFGGGVLADTPEKNGLTNIMTKMLLKGNDLMTAAEIADRLDFLGANVSASGYREFSEISIVALTENFEEALQVVSRSLASPTFPEDELEKLKVEVEGMIKSDDDNQSRASSQLFWRTAYGGHDMGLPSLGTAESIAKIGVADLQSQYTALVGGQNLILSIASDLPVEEISRLVHSTLGRIPPEANPPKAPALTLQDEKIGFREFDRNQSFIYTGAVFDHLAAEEVAYLVLLNQVMGANVGSRLWYLRQDEKLAYSVFTQYVIGKHNASFRAGLGTDTSKVGQALESLDREWSSMIAEGITAEELEDARINMKNNLIYAIDRKGNRADNMAFYEYIGYDYRFILDLIEMADLVRLEQINEFIKKEFSEDCTYTSVVGKM